MPGGRAAIFLAGPVSAFVDTPAERLAKSLIIAAIMSIQDGQHPRVMQDLLKSYVPRSGAPVGATRPRLPRTESAAPPQSAVPPVPKSGTSPQTSHTA